MSSETEKSIQYLHRTSNTQMQINFLYVLKFRSNWKTLVPHLHDHVEFWSLIVSCFEKLAKSNTLIFAFELSVVDRQEFHNRIMNACQCFLELMNSAQRFKARERKITRATVSSNVRRVSDSEEFINVISEQSEDILEEESDNRYSIFRSRSNSFFSPDLGSTRGRGVVWSI